MVPKPEQEKILKFCQYLIPDFTLFLFLVGTRGRILCSSLTLFAIVKARAGEELLSCYSLFSINCIMSNKIFTSGLDFCCRNHNRYALNDFLQSLFPIVMHRKIKKIIKLLLPSHNYCKVLTNFR